MRIVVDLGKTFGPFPHYWENTVGSDRAAVFFREQWQRDLKLTASLTGMKSVRCHGLFNDEMGVCKGLDAAGKLRLSFLYISQIYDILLTESSRFQRVPSLLPTRREEPYSF